MSETAELAKKIDRHRAESESDEAFIETVVNLYAPERVSGRGTGSAVAGRRR